LTKAVRQGKTRYVGFSEWPLDRIEAAAKMPGVVRFVSSQPQYSLLRPTHKKRFSRAAPNSVSARSMEEGTLRQD